MMNPHWWFLIPCILCVVNASCAEMKSISVDEESVRVLVHDLAGRAENYKEIDNARWRDFANALKSARDQQGLIKSLHRLLAKREARSNNEIIVIVYGLTLQADDAQSIELMIDFYQDERLNAEVRAAIKRMIVDDEVLTKAQLARLGDSLVAPMSP